MSNPALIAIDRWLAAQRPAYYARLRPGVTDRELDAFDSRFSLKLPMAFRELYRWRNGQPAACSESFQDNRMFVSLEDIAGTKEELDGMIGTDFEDPRWWRRGWVPFLSNGGGDYLCVDLSAGAGGTQGQLLEFLHDSPDRRVEYPEVGTWLNELAAAMEAGRFGWV